MLSVILVWLSATEAQSTLRISPPAAVPANASAIINPSFAGFGIEPSNLFSFTGYDTPNPLTFNLINNLVNYTGQPPHLRIGGNTNDYMVFSADQNNYTWITNPYSTGQGAFASDSMLIGPKFFEVANRFPTGTPVTWGLNLAYQESDYETRLVTMAQQLVKGIPNLKLVSIEIGNEPDLYLQNGFRTGAWGGQVYLQQWSNRAQFIWNQVLKPLGLPSNFFEPGATASTIGTTFMITDLANMGALANANGSNAPFTASFNEHDYYYYIGVSTYPLTLQSLMTLSTTETQFIAWTTQIQQATAAGYPYALREMCSVGPIGLEGITNTFGAALWTLNFFLYGATLNISSIQMHQTDNSNASAWQPLYMYDRQPFVRPNYYAWAAFDQLIGPSCQAQVAPLDVSSAPGVYADTVRAYTIYQASQLATIVVINANLANASSPTKSNLTVILSLPSSLAGKVLHLSYLTSAGADAIFNTTWNGLSFEQAGDGTPSVVDGTDQTVTVGEDGSATLTVRDSQAVAANIGARVGSGTANSAACAAIAAKSTGWGPSATALATGMATSTGTAGAQATGGTVSSTSTSTTSGTGGNSTGAVKNSLAGIGAGMDMGLGFGAVVLAALVGI